MGAEYSKITVEARGFLNGGKKEVKFIKALN